jgi:hypothetical protein
VVAHAVAARRAGGRCGRRVRAVLVAGGSGRNARGARVVAAATDVVCGVGRDGCVRGAPVNAAAAAVRGGASRVGRRAVGDYREDGSVEDRVLPPRRTASWSPPCRCCRHRIPRAALRRPQRERRDRVARTPRSQA